LHACPEQSGNEHQLKQKKRGKSVKKNGPEQLAVASEQLAKSTKAHRVSFEVKNAERIFCILPIANW